MSRPQKCRRVCAEPRFTEFSPRGVSSRDVITLSTDEYEVFRLVDYENKTHEECAKQMDISRTTVTEIYDSARKKIAKFLVNGLSLKIQGGNYRICDGSAPCCMGKMCGRTTEAAQNPAEPEMVEKEQGSVRLAIVCKGDDIFPHFGHSESFVLYDVKDGVFMQKNLVKLNGIQRGALPGILKKFLVDKLICDGIGTVALNALYANGIEVFSGISGNAQQAFNSWLNGCLNCDNESKL